jgi:hypothetical protein
MSIFNITAADTGLTSSDSILHTFRTLDADTGLIISDSTVLKINRVKAQTGLTITSSIAAGIYTSCSDTGLTTSDSIVSAHGKARIVSDTLTFTDSIGRFTGRQTVVDNGIFGFESIYPPPGTFPPGGFIPPEHIYVRHIPLPIPFYV